MTRQEQAKLNALRKRLDDVEFKMKHFRITNEDISDRNNLLTSIATIERNYALKNSSKNRDVFIDDIKIITKDGGSIRFEE